MLVLTRKLQETIRIGDQITITVLRVQGRKVRIGIAAPRDVRVSRGEIEVNLDEADVLGSDLLEGDAGESASEPALAAAVQLALADEPGDTADEGPATLHKIIHRRVRRDQLELPSERTMLPNDRPRKAPLTLRDLLQAR